MSLQLGLRARVAANLAAAVSITFALLALSTLVLVRNDVRQAWREGAEQLADALAAHASSCGTAACVDALFATARSRGHELSFGGPEAPRATRVVTAPAGEAGLEVVRPSSRGTLVLRVPYAPIAERARAAANRLLWYLLLDGLALVVLGTLLFERSIVRRLAQVDEAIEKVDRLGLDTPMLVEEGDEIGRMAGSVRRMVERLRDDKRRSDAYIEELERANKALTQTRAGLVRSEKLATVGRLAAGVAHEIGNPVAAVLGYLDILRMKKGAPSPEYLERIERETRRIDRIVRDLLDFARPRPLQLGPVGLADVVRAAARLVEPQPRWRAMKLVTEVPADLPAVKAQEHHATQVLVNLLINAADACAGQGTVTVRAHAAGEWVELTVADDGPGFAPEDASRLFEPFFTTKAPGEGTGLGLSICHSVMESFDGSISARAGDGRGATFTLRFRPAERGD